MPGTFVCAGAGKFRRALGLVKESEVTFEQLLALFSRLDKDKSNSISLDELREGMKLMGRSAHPFGRMPTANAED